MLLNPHSMQSTKHEKIPSRHLDSEESPVVCCRDGDSLLFGPLASVQGRGGGPERLRQTDTGTCRLLPCPPGRVSEGEPGCFAFSFV